MKRFGHMAALLVLGLLLASDAEAGRRGRGSYGSYGSSGSWGSSGGRSSGSYGSNGSRGSSGSYGSSGGRVRVRYSGGSRGSYGSRGSSGGSYGSYGSNGSSYRHSSASSGSRGYVTHTYSNGCSTCDGYVVASSSSSPYQSGRVINNGQSTQNVVQSTPYIRSVPSAAQRQSAQPAPVAKAAPAAKPAPVTKAEPAAKPAPAVKAEPAARPAPVVKAEPAAKPAPVVKAEPAAKPAPVVKAEPAAKPAPVVKSAAKAEVRTFYPSIPEHAILVVHVPEDAEIYLAGTKMTAVGSVRSYRIPLKDVDRQYNYPIRLKFVRQGKTLSTDHMEVLTAGKTVVLKVDEQDLEKVVELARR